MESKKRKTKELGLAALLLSSLIIDFEVFMYFKDLKNPPNDSSSSSSLNSETTYTEIATLLENESNYRVNNQIELGSNNFTYTLKINGSINTSVNQSSTGAEDTFESHENKEFIDICITRFNLIVNDQDVLNSYETKTVFNNYEKFGFTFSKEVNQSVEGTYVYSLEINKTSHLVTKYSLTTVSSLLSLSENTFLIS